MEAVLEAVKRSGKGKNEARRLRAAGHVPAVVYGAQKAGDAIAPVQVAVSPKEMMRILHSASGVNTLITLNVAGESTQRVLVREFQLDPVTQHLLHADFYRVNLERKIAISVPIVLHGEPKGVKQQDGVLEFLHKEIEVECLPTQIPEHVDIDVSDLELGQAIYVRDIAANATWVPLSENDLMLVHVVSAKVVAEPAAEAAAAAPGAAEPEVAQRFIQLTLRQPLGEARDADVAGVLDDVRQGEPVRLVDVVERAAFRDVRAVVRIDHLVHARAPGLDHPAGNERLQR
jgi:large subunit ribosomal protein L25